MKLVFEAPLATIVALSLSAGSAAAGESAFKITGGGVATSGLPLPGQAPRQHWSVGTATHLGQYAGDGTVKTDSAVFDPSMGTLGGLTGEFGSGSAYTFTAADGSKLATWYGRTDKGASAPGTFTLTIVDILPGPTPEQALFVVTARFVAEFVVSPTESTDRFAGATGRWTMIADTEPFILGSTDAAAYTWQGEGTLNTK